LGYRPPRRRRLKEGAFLGEGALQVNRLVKVKPFTAPPFWGV
jgi:hypothetical protein